jgi:ubiquinone/menaquinone biosynthesis C-methylase UbiE
MSGKMQHGNFTGLGKSYAENRPDYSQEILDIALNKIDKNVGKLDVIDIGAGTGIWTRMISSRQVNSIVAIEPNDDMRQNGENHLENNGIVWKSGSAEVTGMPDNCADWVSMASSFHWADFDLAIKEFHRILRSGGLFTALWNPRLIEASPLLVEIENHITILKPDLKRVSSGRSGITDTLAQKLTESKYLEFSGYHEARHEIKMSPERYMGAWRSVNDLRVQLGEDLFEQFLGYVEDKIYGLREISTTYLTRAWFARKS